MEQGKHWKREIHWNGEKRFSQVPLYLVGGFSAFAVSLYGPFINFYAVLLGASFIAMGWLTSVRNLFTNVLQIIWGYLADVTGKRKLIFIGYLFIGVVVFLVVFIENTLLLILAVTVLSILLSLTMPAWVAVMGDYSSESTRGKVVGLVGAVSQFSSVVAYVVVAALTYNSSSETGLSNMKIAFILSGFSALLASITALGLKEKKRLRAGEGIKINLKEVLKNRVYRKFLLITGFNGFSMSVSWPIFPYLTVKLTNAETWEMALIWASWSLSNSISQRFFGRKTDMWGRKPVMLTGRIMLFTIPLGFILARSWLHLVVTMLLAGVLMAMAMVSETAYIIDSSVEERRGTYTAVYNTAQGFLTFTGSMVGGGLTDMFTQLASDLYAAYIVLFLSTMLRLISGSMYIFVDETVNVEPSMKGNLRSSTFLKPGRQVN